MTLLKTRAAVLVAAVLAAAPAFAGEGAVTDAMQPTEVAARDAEGFGVSSPTVATMSVFDCDTFSQADTWSAVGGTPNRFLTAGLFECAVHVPSGALVTRIEVEACDTNAAAEVLANFVRTTTAGGGGTPVAVVGSGSTPGCGYFGLNLATPEAIDNLNRKYFFQISTGTTSATSVAAVRVFYQLQVSPAPATATFTDVPTSHAFFRFVEALAASGVTGGCGGGNFCPDTAITRGQMAVFLASALGLHFPN